MFQIHVTRMFQTWVIPFPEWMEVCNSSMFGYIIPELEKNGDQQTVFYYSFQLNRITCDSWLQTCPRLVTCY